MGRINDALLNMENSIARGSSAPMLDPMYGGQMGYAPNYTEWVSNQQYIRQNAIPILLEAPTGFASLPNPEKWVGILRALIETHAIRITGLSNTLTVETADTPFDAAGGMQRDPTNVTVSQSNITMEWNEKYGMPVNRFFDAWIRHLIKDPYSKFATINTLAGNLRVGDMLADRYSMTIALIEPDPTHTRVVKAALLTGMYPLSAGEVVMARDITAGGENVNYSIEFPAIVQYGLGVNRMCQTLLDNIDITGASPFTMSPFIEEISADVLATARSYNQSVENTKNPLVTL